MIELRTKTDAIYLLLKHELHAITKFERLNFQHS